MMVRGANLLSAPSGTNINRAAALLSGYPDWVPQLTWAGAAVNLYLNRTRKLSEISGRDLASFPLRIFRLVSAFGNLHSFVTAVHPLLHKHFAHFLS